VSFRAQARSTQKPRRPRPRPAQATSALVPAGARHESALDTTEALLNADAIEMFAKAVGGREKLADTLAVAGAGQEVERVTTLLLDPRYGQWSLARVCQTVGITVADLFAYYRKALMARAHIEASHIIAAKLPPVVTDVMDKALSDPTVERHKLALDLGQLLDKKGGLIVQQNNLAALATTQTGSLEQLQQAVGDLLFGGGQAAARPAAGEVVEDEPAPDDPSDPTDEEPDDDTPDDPDADEPEDEPEEPGGAADQPRGVLKPDPERDPAEPELPFGEPGLI
jgi:hypothetical protein